MIEKGRHRGLEKEESLCPFWAEDKMEDEYNFIFECPIFIHPRREIFDIICLVYPNFICLDPIEKIKIVLDQEDTADDCYTYLEKAVYIREFLINKLKSDMWILIVWYK